MGMHASVFGSALIIACIYGTLPQGVADNGMLVPSIRGEGR